MYRYYICSQSLQRFYIFDPELVSEIPCYGCILILKKRKYCPVGIYPWIILFCKVCSSTPWPFAKNHNGLKAIYLMHVVIVVTISVIMVNLKMYVC